MKSESPIEDPMTSRIHNTYLEYNRTLRAWYVGFGVGGPVLVLTQKHLWDVIAKSDVALPLTLWFVFGVAVQIFIAILNKWMNWLRYEERVKSTGRNVKFVRIAEFYREYFAFQLISDLGTALIYGMTIKYAITAFMEG